MQPAKRASGAWSKGERAPALHIGVFGKHPGWDDHIDDLGLDNERLVRVRQRLYTEGVAGNIDSGAWEKLDEPQRLPGFGHELVWRSREGLVVGRLWSSRDGKGRTKYPMAVVAHVTGVAWSWVESVVMPRLAEVERACTGTESADEVRRLIDQARIDLRTALPLDEQELGGLAGAPALAALAEIPELGPDHVGLHRALYEIEREMGAFRPARSEGRRSTAREITLGPRHLRVPAGAPATLAAAGLWAGLLATQIDPDADVLVLRRLGAPWIDIVVGDPGPAQLFCLRASETGLALVTSVPYTLEAPFVARCEALVGAWRAGRLTAEPTPEPPPAPGPRPDAPPGAEPPRKRPPWKLWGGAGAGALVLAAGSYFVYESQHKPASSPTGPIAMNTPPAAAALPARGDLAPELKARQEEAKARLDPKVEEAARLERERKARDEEARTAKDAADRKAKDEADRLAKETADRTAREAAERKAKEEADRLAKETADQRAKEDAARRAREEQDRLAAEAKAAAARNEEIERARAAARESDRLASERRAALVARARDLGAMLDAGWSLSDTTGSGSVGAAAKALRADPEYAQVADAPEVAALAKRCATIESIDRSVDGAELARIATSPSGLAESLAAWSRLASGAVQGWPASAKDVTDGAAALANIRVALLRSPDRAHAADAGARVDEQARAVWAAFFGTLGENDTERLGAACAARDAFKVDAAALPARQQFNVALWDFRRSAAALEGEDGAKALAAAFVAQVGRMGGEVADRPEVKGALAGLAPGAGAPSGGNGDPASAGPALRGWKGEARDIAGHPGVVFSLAAEGGRPARRLEFVRVQTPSGAAYLCTTEVSLGLFIDVVTLSNAWAEVALTLKGKEFKGPRPWAFEGPGTSAPAQRIRVSEAGGDLGRGWVTVGNKTRGAPYYPDPSRPEPPTADSPMQFISPVGAVYAANLVGCRLPTSAEWAAAQGMNSASGANRRDRSWKDLVDFLEAKPPDVRSGLINLWPDDGQFVPEGAPAYQQGGRLEAAVADTDGWVWFNPVDQGEGLFKNLVGNVAEYVCDEPGLIEPGPGRTPARVRDDLKKGDSVRVIGASALSALEVSPSQPGAMKWSVALRGGYSDVGFRLAFSAPAGAPAAAAEAPSVLAAVRKAAGELKYLSP